MAQVLDAFLREEVGFMAFLNLDRSGTKILRQALVLLAACSFTTEEKMTKKKKNIRRLHARDVVVLGFRQPCAKALPCFCRLLCDVLREGCASNQIIRRLNLEGSGAAHESH